MKKHTTRRALLMSVLSLLLCVSMLVGTTYAWFTDEVVSGMNTISAGNLDVELLADGKEVKADTKLFADATLWEPGVVVYENLQIVNKGTLALKYQMSLNFGNENDLGGHKLSEVLKVAVIDKIAAGADRAEILAAAKAATNVGSLYDFFVAGELEANKATAEQGVVIFWEPGENDNLYNANNGKTSSNGMPLFIEFGVNLQATQYTYEKDSFDEMYDKDAIYADKTYVVEGNATLADTLANVNAAQDEIVLVKLNADATWETADGNGASPWVDANSSVKELIVDANGNTITATGKGVGAIMMANGGTLTIKNATIKDESVSYAENSWEYGYLEFDGNVVFENVNFVNAIFVQGESATFKNCTFNSNKDNEYAVWVYDGSATFAGCTFSGPRGLKTHEDYGSEVDTVLVDNCTFENITKKPGVAIGTVNADTTITIKNSDFINCQPGDQSKYIYETDTDVTTFNFDCSENNEIIKVVAPDLVITTAEELFAFAKSVNVDGNSYAGKIVTLGADIDLDNAEWTPVGQTGGNGVATYFQGMFDGKGYTIKNLKITDNAYDEGANYAAGLFGFVDAGDAQIVNLTVDGADVNGHHWTGVIAGYLTGKISGCTVKNATVRCTHANGDACGDKAGVITGYVNSGSVTNNTVYGCTVTAGRDAGQVAGAAKVTYVYDNYITNVTVSAGGDCTGANIKNAEIGRIL